MIAIDGKCLSRFASLWFFRFRRCVNELPFRNDFQIYEQNRDWSRFIRSARPLTLRSLVNGERFGLKNYHRNGLHEISKNIAYRC